MPGAKKPSEVPQAIRDEFRDLAAKLKAAQVVRRIYGDVLTAKEKKRIEDEGLDGVHIANAVATVRKITVNRAVLDLARQVGLLTTIRHRQLLKHIDEPYKPARKANERGVEGKPDWNGDTCELFYNGQIVRKVRGRKAAPHIAAILDGFQEEGWARRIDCPLVQWKDSQRLREAVASLNRGLKGIRFRMDGSGQGVVWEKAEPAQRN